MEWRTRLSSISTRGNEGPPATREEVERSLFCDWIRSHRECMLRCRRRRSRCERPVLRGNGHCCSEDAAWGQTGGEDGCERSNGCEESGTPTCWTRMGATRWTETGDDFLDSQQTTALKSSKGSSALRRAESRTSSNKRIGFNNSTASATC